MISFSPQLLSLDQLDRFAQDLASQLQGGEVLALSGDLGAGKTTFTQGLARYLGVEPTVISPTFILVKEYQGSQLHLYHSDWYRLNSASAIRQLGLDEVMGQSDSIVVIEWPERAPDLVPDTAVWINFTYVNGQTRHISLIT